MPFQKTNSNAGYEQNPGDEDGTHAVITGVEPLYVRYGVYGWLVQRVDCGTLGLQLRFHPASLCRFLFDSSCEHHGMLKKAAGLHPDG